LWYPRRVDARSMLRLLPPAASRREDFHSGRMAMVEVTRDPVLSRWRRVASRGLPPTGAAHPEGVTRAELADRRARVEWALAEPLGDQGHLSGTLVQSLAARPAMVLLADADGVIVWSSPGRFAERAVEARLVEGASWHEETRGTNAIGTALHERQSVAVIGAAHYELMNHGLFCYATPILDPYGDLLGVFDVTGSIESDDPMLATAVQCMGVALERALRTRAYATAVAGGIAPLERLLDRCAMPALLVEAPGRVRRLNDPARRELGASAATATTAQLFGVGWDELVQAALLARGAPALETRSPRRSLTLDPILGPEGRVLSILAYIDPARARPTPLTKTARSAPPRPRPATDAHPAFAALSGSDPAVLRAKSLAARLAPTDVPILLLAETGTGKELMARAIHAASGHARGPFLSINCGSISPQLLESELFGFAPGAFTGARQGGSEGKIAAAAGGTLFLDEIGEMPAALQALLLRVLEDGTYFRIGESVPRKAAFRLLCATCRDLPAMVASQQFRDDLFYRIYGATVTLPPLRARGDRLQLSEALLADLATNESLPCPTLAADAVRHIEREAWPGNVRELKNALRYALLIAAPADEIHAADFPPVLVRSEAPTAAPSRSLRDTEVNAVESALRAAKGNMSQAARDLGVSRSTLYRMMDRMRRPVP
jgi:sigma-54 dependent transcriptional regulator, acetoin dehydrogenase operon transcriptional activator AcoR